MTNKQKLKKALQYMEQAMEDGDGIADDAFDLIDEAIRELEAAIDLLEN